MATPPASAPQFALMGQALKVIKDEQKSGFIEVAGAHAKLNDKLANIHSKVAALKTDSSTVKSDVADIKSDLATLTTNVAALADLVNTIIKAIDPNNNPATFHKSKSKDITAELQAATVRVDRTTYKDGALAEEVWHTQVLALKARDPPFFPFVGNALLEATAATKKYANGEAANLKRRMAERLGAFLTEFDAKNVVTTIGDTIPDRDAERLQLAKVARAILTVFKADVPDGAGRSADECAIACMTPEMTSRFVLLFLHHCGFKADKDAKSLCRRRTTATSSWKTHVFGCTSGMACTTTRRILLA
ncbi:hypothetical protein BC828DRAFT_165828 [Blastocladiella britannica]|nr:hypothetical protein BC828DRAFT_165828 [Blastocladiella britannica]